MNRWIFPIIVIAAITGCDKPPSKTLESGNATSGVQFKEPQKYASAGDAVRIVELKAVPATGKENRPAGSIKSTLSFEEKIVDVDTLELLNEFTSARRVVPVHWDDLPPHSTEYLSKFAVTRAHDRTEPPIAPGVDLNLQARWWVIFDFDGDNVADWIGLRVGDDDPPAIDLICICTAAGQDVKVIRHTDIPIPAGETRSVVFPGRKSVQGSEQKKQQFYPNEDEIEQFRETFGRMIYWNGKVIESLPGKELRARRPEQDIRVGCAPCVYFYIDYSWFKYYQTQTTGKGREPDRSDNPSYLF